MPFDYGYFPFHLGTRRKHDFILCLSYASPHGMNLLEPFLQNSSHQGRRQVLGTKSLTLSKGMMSSMRLGSSSKTC